MSTRITIAQIPSYTLMDGQHRIGPAVATTDPGVKCKAIYGFSSKHHYDSFRDRSQPSLKPYPLTQFHVRGQVENSDAVLNLVVIDAAGPDEAHLQAAAMKAVLDAMENRSSTVESAYRLTLETQTSTYHVR